MYIACKIIKEYKYYNDCAAWIPHCMCGRVHVNEYSIKVADGWYAQASSEDRVVNLNNPDTTSVTVDAERTTAFVENTQVVKADFSGMGVHDLFESKFSSIKDFLAKPYLVSSTQWTTSQAAQANVWVQDLAGYLNGGGSSIATWTNKLLGFNLVRGDFHIRVEMTANRFQQGMLVLHYLPCVANFSTNYANMHNATLNGVLQQPHVLINAADSSAEICVPYIAPTSHFDLNHFTYSWGTVWLDVLSPLLTGSAGEDFVRVNVYAWIDNVEIAAPIVPQANDEDRPGPIEDGLSNLSNGFYSLAKVPLISEIAAPLSWVLRIGSGVAGIFGWSKPIISTQPEAVTRQQWRYSGVAEGADSSIPLGLSYDNRLSHRNYSIRTMDEMSMKFLLSVPNYLGSLSWTTSTASATSLLTTNLTPGGLAIDGSSTHNGHTAGWSQGAPIAYLSNFFNLWRGSFKLKVKVIKTEMHKGRLQVTWTPSDAISVTPTLTSSIYSMRHLIDIAQKDTFEFNLPYLINRPYLPTNTSTLLTNISSGQLDILVLNELRCPETCSATVNVLYWIEAGDDFEYAAPGCSNPSDNYTVVPFAPQGSIDDRTDTLIQAGIGGSIVQKPTLVPSKECIGERCLSVKQLINRLSQVFPTGSFPTAISTAIYPWFTGEYTINTSTGALVAPLLTADMPSYLMPMYAFMRGGMRISFSAASATTNSIPPAYQVLYCPQAWPASSNVVGTGTAASGNYSSFTPSATGVSLGASTTETDSGLGMVSVRTPYYSMTPITATVGSTTTVPTRYDTPLGVVQFVNKFSTNSSDTVVYRSGMDDFQLTFFVGCPPLLVSYS